MDPGFHSCWAVLHCSLLYVPQPFHGDKELVESDAVLDVPLSAVRGKARVFSLEKFQGLSRVGALDYFARLAYRVRSSGWAGL